MVNHCKASSIGEAWLEACKVVLESGLGPIEDDKGAIIELVPFIIEIDNPRVPDTIIDFYGDKLTLEFMARNFQDLSPVEGWRYSYAQRLYSSRNINQIKDTIELLKKNSFSKSATLSLLMNEADTIHKPCLVAIDFKIRTNRLIINAFFRSQDIGKKMYADALELLKIGQAIMSQLSIKDITIIHFICSAHIYVKDAEQIKMILQERNL